MDLKEYVLKNKKQIVGWRDYLKQVDWTTIQILNKTPNKDGEFLIDEKETADKKQREFKLQHGIAINVYKRLKHLTKTYNSERKKPQYINFLEICLSVLNLFIETSEEYDLNIDLISIQSDFLREKELELQTEIFSKLSDLREKLADLDISTDSELNTITFLTDKKAPLILHEKLSVIYPQINDKLKELGVSFSKEPIPMMHIHNKKPPVWDLERHYFDQDTKVLQYWIDELNKCKDGINLDGVYISGWMYFHINHFVTKYPTTKINSKTGEEEQEDITGVPPLRDNEWWIINDNYEEARRKNKMMFIAATRRAAKTTLNTSHIGWCVVTGRHNILLAGGSSDDLGHIKDNFEVLEQSITPALRWNNLVNDWTKFVDLGIKTKDSKNITVARIKVVNLDGGADKKSESLAGFTPSAVIIDEIMKIHFKKQVEGLRPALGGGGSKNRCVVMLTGTAGSAELAQDAFDYLRDPDAFDVLQMNWDLFNSRVPEEYRTWKERPFGTFLPGQMSAKTGLIKQDSDLSTYLNKDGTEIKKVKIKVTDWQHSIDVIKADRKKKEKDLEAYTKEVLYHPICPSDMLLSGKVNPFPLAEAIAHRERIKSEGGRGIKCYLTQDQSTGKIDYTLSNNPLPEYPWKGGFIDAPVVLYEPLPKEKPMDYLYVAGCLTPNQIVLTDSGWKKVQDVSFNDKLISKDGEEVNIKTLFTHLKDNTDVYEITVGNTYRTTTFTKEHPIYISRPLKYTQGASKGRTKTFDFENFNFERAENVKKGDWIKYPNTYISKNSLDFKGLWYDFKDYNQERDNPLLKLDFWYFIGLYLGDGWLQRNSGKIAFAVNKSETVTINSIVRIVKELFDRKCYVNYDKGENLVEITFTDKKLHKFLDKNFGQKADGKFLSEWAKKIPEEFKYEILCGYLNSDGCFMNLPNGYLLSEFVSINLRMLEDIQDVLFSLGIVSSLTLLRNEGKHTFPNGFTSKTKKTYMLRVNQFGTVKLYNNFRKDVTQKHPKILRELKREEKSKGVCFISKDNKYIYFKIKKINKSKYSGLVYNFECETNTFLTHHITTHNCDDYKQEEAGTDSVGSFHIYKVDVGLDKYCGKIVASLATRPDPHNKLHRQMFLLQQAFNARCLMENADMDYKTYLENKRVADLWLQETLDFDADITKQGTNRRKYGWTPTPKNKKNLFSQFVNYCKREFEVYNEEGDSVSVLGVELIDDIGLLDEIIAYSEGNNVDRITSAMSCLGYEQYLHANYLLPNLNRQIQKTREDNRKIVKNRTGGMFTKSSLGIFR